MNGLKNKTIVSWRWVGKHISRRSFLQAVKRQIGDHIPLLAILTINGILYLSAGSSFKFFVGMSVLCWGVIQIVGRNALFSTLTLTILASQFFEPSYAHPFLLIPPQELSYDPLRSTGLIESYGLTLSDIWAGILVWQLVRLFFFSKNKINVRRVYSPPLLKTILICFGFYFLLSLFSSLYTSYLPILSVNALFQSMKVVPVLIATATLLSTYQSTLFSRRHLLICIPLSIILFQTAVVAIESVRGLSSISHNQEVNQVVSVVENNTVISRAKGTFYFANQLAIITFSLWLVSIYLFNQFSVHPWLKTITYASSLFILVLSQSRVVWGIGLVCTILLLPHVKKYLQSLIKGYLTHIPFRFTLVLVACLLAGIAVTLPRVSQTWYTTQEYGSLRIRWQMYEEGLLALQEKPWLGFGVNTNVFVLHSLFPNGYTTVFPFSIHMAYLQMALESGLVATGFFFVAISLVPYLIIRTFNPLTQKNRFFPSSFLICVGISDVLCYTTVCWESRVPFFRLFNGSGFVL